MLGTERRMLPELTVTLALHSCYPEGTGGPRPCPAAPGPVVSMGPRLRSVHRSVGLCVLGWMCVPFPEEFLKK